MRSESGTRGQRPLDRVRAVQTYDAIWVTDRAIAESAAKSDAGLAAWSMELVVLISRAALAE